MKSEVKSEVVGLLPNSFDIFFFFLHWFNIKSLSDLVFPWLTPKIDQSKHNIKAPRADFQAVLSRYVAFNLAFKTSLSLVTFTFLLSNTVSADLALSLSVVIKVAWVLFAMLRTKTITKYWACALLLSELWRLLHFSSIKTWFFSIFCLSWRYFLQKRENC